MKCQICGGKAKIDLNHHNLKICENCFISFFKKKVEKTIKKLKLFEKDEKLLLAVSGGKDSMGLWHILSHLDYNVDGIYIDLGFGEVSNKIKEKVEDFAKILNKKLFIIELKERIGFDLKELSKFTNRVACSLCGLVKRYIMNEIALKENYSAIITGHNLDDEASVLLKNVLRWEFAYLGRQSPLLESMDGFVKKVKPYIFCYEKETLLYAIISKIPYIKDTCPYSTKSKNKTLKMAFHILEHSSPGIKLNFMKLFLKNRNFFIPFREREIKELVKKCNCCGYPTDKEICALCTILERSKNENSIGERQP